MTGKFTTLADLFEEDEQKRLAAIREEDAKEAARVAALTPEQREAEEAARKARYEELFAGTDEEPEDEDEEEEDEGEFDDD